MCLHDFTFFHAYGHFIIDFVIVGVGYKLQQLLLASLDIDADFEANPKSYLDNTIDLLRSDQSCIWKHLLSKWMGWMDLCHKLARSRCCKICQRDWSDLECANIYITPSYWFCAAPQGSQWRTRLRKWCTMAYRFRRQIDKLTSRMATVLNPTGINVVLPYCLANFVVTCCWLRELRFVSAPQPKSKDQVMQHNTLWKNALNVTEVLHKGIGRFLL